MLSMLSKLILSKYLAELIRTNCRTFRSMRPLFTLYAVEKGMRPKFPAISCLLIDTLLNIFAPVQFAQYCSHIIY